VCEGFTYEMLSSPRLLSLIHTDMLIYIYIGRKEIRVQDLHIAKISRLYYEIHKLQCFIF